MAIKNYIINKMRSYPRNFWVLNAVQMIEKLAYWVVLLQMPVYIAQKDVAGGLQWGQNTKGIIFFVWAAVQNLSPLVFGIWADKYGRKRFLLISFIIIIIAYILLGLFRDLSLFIASIILLSIGLGMFKPALQGAIASNLNEKNSSTGWGIYFMLLNIAVFFGPALSKYLKEISWEMVFWGSAAVFTLNFIAILLFKENIKTDSGNTHSENKETNGSKKDIPSVFGLKEVFSNLLKPQIFLFIITMSGFIMIYMQFYETLPNFFVDWTDTSGVVSSLGLPSFLLMETERGIMISYEWLYTLNSILIIAFIVGVARLFSGKSRTSVIALGILLATLGLITIGTNMTGILAIAGIVIYTFGEMITNPKFNEYLGMIAPKKSKSMYLSYLNISLAIGLGVGSLLGGFFYGRYGEKATMAVNYLRNNFGMKEEIDPSQAMTLLCEKANITMAEATQILWDKYDPYIVWIPFAIIGLISFVGMIMYGRKWT
jgi:POT family proton-dependent oligopeptide transporter